MLSGAAGQPETLELGTGVGEVTQDVTNTSADERFGVELSGATDAEGNLIPDSARVGTKSSVPIATPPEGGTSIHSHPDLFVGVGGSTSVFVDSDGRPTDPADTQGAFASIAQPPGGNDIAVANFLGENQVIGAGDSTFALVPSEEGARAHQTDVTSLQDLDNKAAQAEAHFVQNQENGIKRAVAESDRSAGDGQGQFSPEQAQTINTNASARAVEAVGGGTLFEGENDGSGTFTRVDADPTIS